MADSLRGRLEATFAHLGEAGAQPWVIRDTPAPAVGADSPSREEEEDDDDRAERWRRDAGAGSDEELPSLAYCSGLQREEELDEFDEQALGNGAEERPPLTTVVEEEEEEAEAVIPAQRAGFKVYPLDESWVVGDELRNERRKRARGPAPSGDKDVDDREDVDGRAAKLSKPA